MKRQRTKAVPKSAAERETFTRLMVALAVNDVEPQPTGSEIDQIADEVLEWGHRLRTEFQRAKVADRLARLSRAELEARLAMRIAPTPCCTLLGSDDDAEPAMLSDDELRERLIEVEAEADMGQMAA